MKIAILFQGDLDKVSIGGIAEYVRNVIRFRGENEITLIGVCHSGDYKINCSVQRTVQGVGYTFLPICDDSKSPLSFWYTLALHKMQHKLDRYDVIYAQRAEYCLALKSSVMGGRLFQIIHGSSAYTVKPLNKLAAKVYLSIERSSIKKCTRTFVIMKREDVGLSYYCNLYPEYKGRFLYGRIPVDTSLFKPCNKYMVREKYSIPENRFLLVYCGRVEDYPKRVLLFPKIVEIIRDINPLFLVVGDGSSMNDLKNEISNRGLEDYFRFFGYCDDRRILAEIAGMADLAINISSFEGTCTSSLESVACGTPVLSTDVGEIKTIVANDSNGFIVPNGIDSQIIEDSSLAIRFAHDNSVPMTSDYLFYACDHAIPELFLTFQKIVKGL